VNNIGLAIDPEVVVDVRRTEILLRRDLGRVEGELDVAAPVAERDAQVGWGDSSALGRPCRGNRASDGAEREQASHRHGAQAYVEGQPLCANSIQALPVAVVVLYYNATSQQSPCHWTEGLGLAACLGLYAGELDDLSGYEGFQPFASGPQSPIKGRVTDHAQSSGLRLALCASHRGVPGDIARRPLVLAGQ
jgi:hypothetical protein